MGYWAYTADKSFTRISNKTQKDFLSLFDKELTNAFTVIPRWVLSCSRQFDFWWTGFLIKVLLAIVSDWFEWLNAYLLQLWGWGWSQHLRTFRKSQLFMMFWKSLHGTKIPPSTYFGGGIPHILRPSANSGCRVLMTGISHGAVMELFYVLFLGMESYIIFEWLCTFF